MLEKIFLALILVILALWYTFPQYEATYRITLISIGTIAIIISIVMIKKG